MAEGEGSGDVAWFLVPEKVRAWDSDALGAVVVSGPGWMPAVAAIPFLGLAWFLLRR